MPLVALSHLILLSSEFPGLCNLNSLELKWPAEANNSTWISIMPISSAIQCSAALRERSEISFCPLPAVCWSCTLLRSFQIMRCVEIPEEGTGWTLRRAVTALPSSRASFSPPRHGEPQGLLRGSYQPQGKASWGLFSALQLGCRPGC